MKFEKDVEQREVHLKNGRKKIRKKQNNKEEQKTKD